MAERPLSKRRVILVIIAVGIPSLALIGLGVGLILQESQLEESRRTEAFEDTFSSFSTSLEISAGEQRDEAALTASEHQWSTEDAVYDSLVVLLGSVIEGELILPWQLSGGANRFDQKIRSGPFGRALLRAERLEYSNGRSGQAVRAYRAITSSTNDTLQTAYAQLSLARALEKSDQKEEADVIRLDVLNLSAQFSDDFGVPLFLYAAQQLVQERNFTDSVEEVLLKQAQFPLYFSPQAAYLYRAVHDTLRAVSGTNVTPSRQQRLAKIEAYAQTALASIRLQEDFRGVFPPPGLSVW